MSHKCAIHLFSALTQMVKLVRGVCMLSSSLFCPGSIYWGMLSISEQALPLLKMALLLGLGCLSGSLASPFTHAVYRLTWTVPNTSLCEP